MSFSTNGACPGTTGSGDFAASDARALKYGPDSTGTVANTATFTNRTIIAIPLP